MTKISNFAHTLPLFYALKMLFRMSSFIYNNSLTCNFASSWVTSPDWHNSVPNCSYKVCSYKKSVQRLKESFVLENSITEYLQKIRCNGNEKKYTMPQTHILKSSREIARYAFFITKMFIRKYHLKIKIFQYKFKKVCRYL